MSTTTIKRLYQGTDEFVPITLAEAVVVNEKKISGAETITTLDKFLTTLLGLDQANFSSISTLQNTVNEINDQMLKSSQLKAGTGINIEIDKYGNITISSTGVSSVNLYKIATTLPTASADCLNSIYLIPSQSQINRNIFTEYLCYETEIGGTKTYTWEQIGTIQSNVDLSGYVTEETFNSTISNITSNIITATDVATTNYSISSSDLENLYK